MFVQKARIERQLGAAMNYPGHILTIGDTNQAAVAAVISALRTRGYGLPAGTNGFDAHVAMMVKVFQSQHADVAGRPLVADGTVGPMTWGALFNASPAPAAPVVPPPPTGLAVAALGIAVTQIGVMEQPINSNSGPMVSEYLRSVGCPDGSSWCMAFVNWCFQHAAAGQGKPDDFPKTGGCIDAWNKVHAATPHRVVTRAQAIADPTLVRPGFVFILDHGGGHGHTGFVRQVIGGALRTIEGNSNNNGSADGVGVFELNRRSVMEADLKGFLDFAAA